MKQLFGPRQALTPLLAALSLALIGDLSVAQTSPVTTAPDGALVWQNPKNGGVRRWQIVGEQIGVHESASVSARLISQLAHGSVLSNLGCSQKGDDLWCKVRPLRGGVRGYVKARHLEPARGPDGIVAMGVNTTKRRARQRDFDATDTIQCAQEQGQSLSKCQAAVARSEGGDATIVATFPNGFARDLYFVHGEFIRASATMSGVGTDTDWQLQGGNYRVRVDDQQYEIPRVFVVPN
ncbi:MAG: hypothetical protein AB8C46_05690 [Burkholderiaceae bacterium]